jgi:hypothetical protein
VQGHAVSERLVRAAAGVAMTVTLLSACTSDRAPADPAPSKRESPGTSSQRASDKEPAAELVPDCPPGAPTPRPTSADEINEGVARGGLPGWQAADIGASARLADGRIVWLFGDTVRTERFDPRIVANSMLLSSRGCVSQLMPADEGPVVPDAADGTVHWPMSVAVGRADGSDVVVVLCSRIDRGDTGAFGFTYLGSSAAVFTVGADDAPVLQKVVRLTRSSRDPQQVNWGAASMVQGSWFYVYGTRLTGRPGDVGRELHVARAPLASPGDRERWQFWDGARWQTDHTRAAVILPSEEGVSQTLSVDAVGGRFVAVSKRGGDLGDFIYEWRSPTPWGPWEAHQELPAPAGYDTDELEYAPLAHPEIRLRSGKLLVSVSRNTTDLQRLLARPQIGRPRFVEVARE